MLEEKTKKNFTETLFNLLLNNNIFRFILIFGIVAVIIFIIISINPFNIINKYPLLTFMSFFILISLASSILLFYNIYKDSAKINSSLDKKNQFVNFFAKKTSEDFFDYLFITLKTIGFILLFFLIIFMLWFLIIYNNNTIYFLNLILISITTIVILTLVYKFFENEFNKKQGNDSKNSLGNFILDLIFFIPCLLLDFIKFVEKQLNITLNSTWILLGIELLFILLYFLIPYFIKSLAVNGGIELLKGPIYTNKLTNLGSYQNLKVVGINKLNYNYNYSISLSLWINPQPINTNINYNKFTSLFNYANKPNILYNAKTNTIKITCETKKNHIVNIFKSNNFPYQSWINFVIVLRTGIMDVFLNKELVASVPNIVPYMNNSNITAGENDGINGGIKDVIYFNRPLEKYEIKWIN